MSDRYADDASGRRDGADAPAERPRESAAGEDPRRRRGDPLLLARDRSRRRTWPTSSRRRPKRSRRRSPGSPPKRTCPSAASGSRQVAGGWRYVTRPGVRLAPAQVPRRHRAQPPLARRARDARDHRVPAADHAAGDPGDPRRQLLVRPEHALREEAHHARPGKKPVVGTPFLYRTTPDFLVRFGLNDLEELPQPEEIEEDLAATVPEDAALAAGRRRRSGPRPRDDCRMTTRRRWKTEDDGRSIDDEAATTMPTRRRTTTRSDGRRGDDPDRRRVGDERRRRRAPPRGRSWHLSCHLPVRRGRHPHSEDPLAGRPRVRGEAEEWIREGRVRSTAEVGSSATAPTGARCDPRRRPPRAPLGREDVPPSQQAEGLRDDDRRIPRSRDTVLDLVPGPLRRRVRPVGRLDVQTEGLLLLTDDGDLAARRHASVVGLRQGIRASRSPAFPPSRTSSGCGEGSSSTASADAAVPRSSASRRRPAGARATPGSGSPSWRAGPGRSGGCSRSIGHLVSKAETGRDRADSGRGARAGQMRPLTPPRSPRGALTAPAPRALEGPSRPCPDRARGRRRGGSRSGRGAGRRRGERPAESG